MFREAAATRFVSPVDGREWLELGAFVLAMIRRQRSPFFRLAFGTSRNNVAGDVKRMTIRVAPRQNTYRCEGGSLLTTRVGRLRGLGDVGFRFPLIHLTGFPYLWELWSRGVCPTSHRLLYVLY